MLLHCRLSLSDFLLHIFSIFATVLDHFCINIYIERFFGKRNHSQKTFDGTPLIHRKIKLIHIRHKWSFWKVAYDSIRLDPCLKKEQSKWYTKFPNALGCLIRFYSTYKVYKFKDWWNIKWKRYKRIFSILENFLMYEREVVAKGAMASINFRKA